MGEATRILDGTNASDTRVTDRLLSVVYDELRRLARHKLSLEGSQQSLQTTALVHEAYLRLAGGEQTWNGRAHFFAAAGEAMRRILVERAREKRRLKRGGNRRRVLFDDATACVEPCTEELLSLHEILDRFAATHPAKAQP